jgi:hypothetical protein
MKTFLELALGIDLLITCCAFDDNPDRTIATKDRQSKAQKMGETYYLNCLGDRVVRTDRELKGCCYLVKRTEGGVTCQKINF